jgi:hypothetical protein
MIVKVPPEWYSIYPVRFSRPSVINDTPQAWTKLKQDYRKFLRELQEAVECFGADRVERDLHDIIKGRQGRTPDEEFDTLLVKEHDLRRAKGKVNKTEFAREFRRQRHLKIKVRSLVKRLDRALEARERRIREKAEFDRMLRKPSVVGSETK